MSRIEKQPVRLQRYRVPVRVDFFYYVEDKIHALDFDWSAEPITFYIYEYLLVLAEASATIYSLMINT